MRKQSYNSNKKSKSNISEIKSNNNFQYKVNNKIPKNHSKNLNSK